MLWHFYAYFFFIPYFKAFAESLLVIPKTLAINSGYDAHEAIVKLVDTYQSFGVNQAIGLDLQSGEPFIPQVLILSFGITKFLFFWSS